MIYGDEWTVYTVTSVYVRVRTEQSGALPGNCRQQLLQPISTLALPFVALLVNTYAMGFTSSLSTLLLLLKIH
jgi:hypothetical protein